MKNIESIQLKGWVKLNLFNIDGDIIQSRQIKNMVVTTGVNYITSRMKDGHGLAHMSHMGLGSDQTSPASSDTDIIVPISSRGLLAVSGGIVVGNTISYSATFGAGESVGQIREAGIFNAASGGIMLCRTAFNVLTKSATDVLTVDWAITLS